MTPFSVVLLHDPLRGPADWGALPADLAEEGVEVVVPEVVVGDTAPYAARYVAGAALEIRRAAPSAPLLLVGEGGAAPLLPGVAAAQRAAHRRVAGYVLADGPLPQPGTPTRAALAAAQLPHVHHTGPPPPPGYDTEPLPVTADWPDAPCGYLLSDPGYAGCARLARLRGWPVVESPSGPGSPAGALLGLAADLLARDR
ncbi:hypothetical protein GCM10027294_32070 [Marinactinospora endophytica]